MDLNNAVSILKMKDFYFSKINFEKTEGFDATSYNNSLLKIGFGKQKQINDNELVLKIQLKVYVENGFNIEMQAVGKFECDNSDPKDNMKAWMLEKNAAAIMFPYIRSEITLITSQPNFRNIIIPPININSLFEKMRQEDADNSN